MSAADDAAQATTGDDAAPPTDGGARRRAARWGWVAVVVAAAAVGWSAGRATLTPPDVEPPTDQAVTYDITEGTVGQVQSFTAQATWPRVPMATNAASGTVTTLEVADGDVLQSGDAVYTVGLQPVIAMPGAVPAFRDMSRGSTGGDVRQLEDFLVTAGFLSVADDRYDAGTEAAVRSWQRSRGLTPSGSVPAAMVLFVPQLPARVVLEDAIRVGAMIAPGQPAVSALADAPDIAVVLAPQQQDSVPLDAAVRVHTTEGTWSGRVASAVTTPEGDLRLALQADDGGAICQDRCSLVPIDGSGRFRTDLVVVPETTGPVVPMAAVVTRSDGSMYVTRHDGRELPVRIIAAAHGRAVVEGVEVGVTIRVLPPAEAARPTASPTSAEEHGP